MRSKIIHLFFAFFLTTAYQQCYADGARTCDTNHSEEQLKQLLKDDQLIREEFQAKRAAATAKGTIDIAMERAFNVKATRVDIKNQLALDEIVAACGWPTAKIFNNSGLHAAFLIVQHANLDYQLKYFQRIENSHEKGEIPSFFFVILLDRMLVRQGKPQKYGTQYTSDEKGLRVLVLPIEDPDGLNERRVKIGMSVIPGYP